MDPDRFEDVTGWTDAQILAKVKEWVMAQTSLPSVTGRTEY